MKVLVSISVLISILVMLIWLIFWKVRCSLYSMILVCSSYCLEKFILVVVGVDRGGYMVLFSVMLSMIVRVSVLMLCVCSYGRVVRLIVVVVIVVVSSRLGMWLC